MTQTVEMQHGYATTQLLDRIAVPSRGFAVIDVETSGFTPPEAVEIAIVLLEADGVISETWNSVVRPVGGVGPTRVHGITREMAASAPGFPDVAHRVHELLDGRRIASHNLHVELKLLRSQFEKVGVRTDHFLVDAVSTWELAQRLLPGKPYMLSDCCSTAGAGVPENHRALSRATATARLLAHLLQLRSASTPSPTAPTASYELSGFEKFANMYRAKLISHVSPIVARLGAHDAEDVVQATLTQVWITWRKQGPPKYPLAYLKQAAARVAVKLVESESRWPRTPQAMLEWVAAPDSILAAELRVDFRRALAELPGRQREVMLLHLQDVSNADIAKRLGIAEGTVAATIRQVKIKLALHLERRPWKKA